MQQLIILHSNDIHGRINGMARIGTLLEQTRAAHLDIPVLYFDAGDVEETSSRLSNLTKGAAMHRLLSVLGCDAAVVGNGGMLRYSHHILKDYEREARYPHLLANVRLPDGSLPPGVQPTALLQVGTLKLGLIGITATGMGDTLFYEDSFGLLSLPTLPLVKDLARQLREEGAHVVILLSHMGFDVDQELARQLQGEIPLIIGAHSHHLLPTGEWVGDTLIVQAGEYAQHLGRLDLTWDGTRLQAQRVAMLSTAEVAPSGQVQEEVAAIETELERYLDSILGELTQPLDYATDRECGVANLLADALRERMQADLALANAGQAFTGPLPAGPLRRIVLWDVCSSPANPGVVEMSGAQLREVVKRGQDRAFAAERPRVMRGLERGLLHLSGSRLLDGILWVGDQPVEPEKIYRVAGSDWELEPYGGYVNSAWKLKPRYEIPIIMREVLEEYIAAHGAVSVTMGRLG